MAGNTPRLSDQIPTGGQRERRRWARLLVARPTPCLDQLTRANRLSPVRNGLMRGIPVRGRFSLPPVTRCAPEPVRRMRLEPAPVVCRERLWGVRECRVIGAQVARGAPIDSSEIGQPHLSDAIDRRRHAKRI